MPPYSESTAVGEAEREDGGGEESRDKRVEGVSAGGGTGMGEGERTSYPERST
jgi:hypothetical protein